MVSTVRKVVSIEQEVLLLFFDVLYFPSAENQSASQRAVALNISEQVQKVSSVHDRAMSMIEPIFCLVTSLLTIWIKTSVERLSYSTVAGLQPGAVL